MQKFTLHKLEKNNEIFNNSICSDNLYNTNVFCKWWPPFDRLYDQEQKPVVKLISQDAKNVDNRKLCLINVAQNKVQKKLC